MKFEGWTAENERAGAPVKTLVYRFLNEASFLGCILASFIFKFEVVFEPSAVFLC